ncbi:MAG: subfamily B ATP-binding cassette protein MsbA [bacterium]|jgi:subfamily B ATP-binding cassette protein MsbA
MKEIIRLLKLVSHYKKHFFFGMLCMLGYSLSTVAPAKYIKNVVDSLGSGKVPKLEKFVLIGVAIVLIFLIKGISYYGQNYLMNSLGQKVIRELRNQLFSKVVFLPTAFFNKKSTGDIISRFTTDLEVLNQAIITAITGPFSYLPQIFILLGLMLYRSWQLFLVTLVLLPIAAFLIAKFGRQNKKITTKRQDKYGELTSLLTETITGVRVVKAFNMEKYEISRFAKENNKLYKYFLRSIRISSYSTPTLELIGATCGAVILTYGGYLIIHGTITGGDFASFLVSFFMLNEPIKKFNGFTLKLQEGSAAAARVFEIIDTDNPIHDIENAKALPPITRDIQIKIDKFAYDPGHTILNNIDITIPAGTVAAFVGSSGSGKTTLVNLIPRFFDIDQEHGSIKIDGRDIRDVQLKSLRAQIAVVTQETILFNDNIKNNISYGNINCTEESIKETARAAYADGFINNLPNGYQQEIGEKGVMLSGGQRQRLSIARALIKDAPILVLDEATSALDTESEREVQGAIENLMKNRTTLVIAHRLSTIQNADMIYVLSNGEVVESGNHKELLEKEGEYHRLYEMQFSD